jgi:hypothetical protein
VRHYRKLARILPLVAGTLLLLTMLSTSHVITANDTPSCLSIDSRIGGGWASQGGLATVGYPITAAYEQPDATTGQPRTVQWFERMRLEHHPDQPPPYDVQPAHLGVERLQQLGIDWRTLEREPGPKEGCLWFEETGHNVCDQMPRQEGFLTYWQSHGVRDARIGDAHAQSLALFGLPITAAEMYYNETFNTFYMVQWFERARFEWHQEQPAGSRVLLGLLGKEMQAAMGGVLPGMRTTTGQVPPCPIDPALLQAVPVAAVPPQQMQALEAELRALVDSWSSMDAVSVTDLQTGQTVSVHGDRRQVAACTIKIPLMIAVAQDIEAGRYTAADVDALVRSAMGPSNTAPARELISIVGGGDISAGIRRINQIMWDMGATDSIITHPPGYYWVELGYATSHGAVNNLLTTNNLNTMLGKLYQGEVLAPDSTDYVLWSMTIAPEWMNDSLGAPLPEGTQFYHKVGQIYEPSNTWNDAGIVVFERNGQPYAYAISYLGSYGSGWQEAYEHAIRLSEVTWRFFNQ